ncbi:hypothetical protein CRE_09140 [Caenorhabditis remanei]|uniref:G-protein coupled receptors family 1 profile domain-containing protein n=1 Tax=Caenorhabditis remanei TaxID=31234 RepID=E3LJJ2_CAERE|nr:hypothetical protein CRE_09140 [Caenorhabditis remanei]
MYQQYTYEDFEGFSQSKAETFAKFANKILFISVSITEFQCVVACVGVIVNLFHLLVLTRKSMSMNSINMIMIGIALCDMFNMSFNVYDTAQILVQTSDKCRPPAPYTVKLIGFWASACEDHSRRLSALFGVMMALIRWLIIKNALNPKYEKFSKSLFAFGAMLVAFLLSSIMTLLFWSRYEVAQVGLWRPPIECTGFPIDYSVPVYKSSVDNIFMTDTSVALQVFSVVDGLIKLIPTAMFPVLTFLLVKELKKAASSRRKVSTVKNEEENSKSEQATRLVILMAITYILSEGPLGIIYVIQGFVMEPPGLVYVFTFFFDEYHFRNFREMTFDLLDIFDVFVSINSISHCFICLGVSSQYRKSAKSLFFCVKCLRRKTKPLPIATKVSVSSAGRVRKTTVDPTAD